MQTTFNVGGDPVSGSVGTSPNTVSISVPAGSYKVLSNLLNIRMAPSSAGNIVEQRKKGQVIHLDGWSSVAGGYVWGRFENPTGKYRYVAVRTTRGQDYLEKTDS